MLTSSKQEERHELFVKNLIPFKLLLSSKLDNIISHLKNIEPKFQTESELLPFEKRLIANLAKTFQVQSSAETLFAVNLFNAQTKAFIDRCVLQNVSLELESDFLTTSKLKRDLSEHPITIELEKLDTKLWSKYDIEAKVEFRTPSNVSFSPVEIMNILQEFLFSKNPNNFVVVPLDETFELSINISLLTNSELLFYLFSNLESNELKIAFRVSSVFLVDPKVKSKIAYTENFLLLTQSMLKSLLFVYEKSLKISNKVSQKLKTEMRAIKRYERQMITLSRNLFSETIFSSRKTIMILLEVKKGPSLLTTLAYISQKKGIENAFEWFDLNETPSFNSTIDHIVQSKARIKVINHFESIFENKDFHGLAQSAKAKQLSSTLATIRAKEASASNSVLVFVTHEFAGNFDAKMFDIVENYRSFSAENLQAFHSQYLSNTAILFEDLLAIKYLFTENDIVTIVNAHTSALANGFASEIHKQHQQSTAKDQVTLDEFHNQSYQETFIKEDKSTYDHQHRSPSPYLRRQNSLKIFVNAEEYVSHLKAKLTLDEKMGTTVEKIPKVRWDDIGGLDEVRGELLKILKVNFSQSVEAIKPLNKKSLDGKFKELGLKAVTLENSALEQNQNEFVLPRKLSEIDKVRLNNVRKVSFEDSEVVEIDQSSELDLEKINEQLQKVEADVSVSQNKKKQLASKSRKGVIFFGPPGTGKTLLAKCLANESKSSFISIKGPELLNMYVGESEKNMRDVFLRAKNSCPCILFFDELDSLLPRRGTSGDSGNVTDRLVAQFLTELENSPDDLLVIAATNRPDLLDPSILSSGKFDKKIFLGIFNQPNQRVNILKSLTKNYELEDGLQLEDIEQLCPQFITGADFYSIVVKTVKIAVKAVETRIEEFIKAKNITIDDFKKELASYRKEVDPKVLLKLDDFREALTGFKPSVSAGDREKYSKLAKEFADIVVG